MGIEPRFTEFDGDDRAALSRVMQENARRRHLTDAMKVSISWRVLEWHAQRAIGGGYRVVTENESDSIPGIESSKEVTAEAVAQVAQVSVATVHRHTAIEKKSPNLLKMVEQGQVGLKTAEQASRVVSGEVLEKAKPEQVRRYSQMVGERPEAMAADLKRAADALRKNWDALARLQEPSIDVMEAVSYARGQLKVLTSPHWWQ